MRSGLGLLFGAVLVCFISCASVTILPGRGHRNEISEADVMERVENPMTYYSRILFLICDDTVEYFGKDVEARNSYYELFLYQVNRRFTTLKDVVVVHALAGIISNETHDLPAVVSDHQCKDDMVNYHSVLEVYKTWLYNNMWDLPEHEAAVLFVTKRLFGQDDCTGLASGVATYVGGVTTIDYPQNRKMWNFAVVTDFPGTFINTRTTAHELAHLYNSEHDGAEDATKCESIEHHLMDPVAYVAPNMLSFSVCSNDQIKNNPYLEYRLLAHPTHLFMQRRRELPGQIVRVKKQCAAYFRTFGDIVPEESFLDVTVDDHFCSGIECRQGPEVNDRQETYIPMEGTACNTDGQTEKWCVFGKCVDPDIVRKQWVKEVHVEERRSVYWSKGEEDAERLRQKFLDDEDILRVRKIVSELEETDKAKGVSGSDAEKARDIKANEMAEELKKADAEEARKRKKAREAKALEAKALEAKALEAKAREAKALEAKAREAKARETEAAAKSASSPGKKVKKRTKKHRNPIEWLKSAIGK